MAKRKMPLNFINLGGGIPTNYLYSKKSIKIYAYDIKKSTHLHVR